MGDNNYVSNKDFYFLMQERKKIIKDCEQKNLPIPKINDKIGKIILDIATNLAYRYNFINYTYRDEMIYDGIENCIQYFHNFDAEKSQNPFAYFTQIIYYAFVRRIQKEQKQSKIKNKLIADVDNINYTVDPHDQDVYASIGETIRHSNDVFKNITE